MTATTVLPQQRVFVEAQQKSGLDFEIKKLSLQGYVMDSNVGKDETAPVYVWWVLMKKQ